MYIPRLLVDRNTFLEFFTKPFAREIYGRQPICALLGDRLKQACLEAGRNGNLIALLFIDVEPVSRYRGQRHRENHQVCAGEFGLHGGTGILLRQTIIRQRCDGLDCYQPFSKPALNIRLRGHQTGETTYNPAAWPCHY